MALEKLEAPGLGDLLQLAPGFNLIHAPTRVQATDQGERGTRPKGPQPPGTQAGAAGPGRLRAAHPMGNGMVWPKIQPPPPTFVLDGSLRPRWRARSRTRHLPRRLR